MGRVVALTIYVLLYVCSELYQNHQIIIDGAMLAGIASGTTVTLSLSKAIYTWFHQKAKKEEEPSQLTKSWTLSNKFKKE